MKHNVKTVSRFLLLSLTLGCGFFALGQNNRSLSAAHAEGEASSTQQRTYTASDFADEVPVDPEQLDVSLIQSTTTDTSQSLNFAFKSKTFQANIGSRYNDIIVCVTDPAYTGDNNNPVKEGFDNYDEETGLPIFDGSILYILKETKDGEVFIPSTYTYSETFIISVSSIGSNCVSIDGHYNGEYGSSTWYAEDGVTLKYNAIHIPETIKTISANAFTGVPAGVSITYEGSSIPSGFATGWTDATNITFNTYGKESYKDRPLGLPVSDVKDELGRPVNFCLGVKPDGVKYVGEAYDRPLVIEFDVVDKANPTGTPIRHVFEELPLTNTNGSAYDSVGRISNLSYSRLYGYKLASNEMIKVDTITFHNIMKFGEGVNINTSQRYSAKPAKIAQTLDLSKIVSFKASSNSTFAGYSMFSLTMDKNLNITSEKYPEPHSLYLDVKTDFYEQNRSKIEQGLTEIRYSLYNLYLSSYHFVYEGKGGQLKDLVLPISTAISYQTLDRDSNNKVSVIIDHNEVKKYGEDIGVDYSDFSANRVRTFEIMNLTIQMDLLTTSDSGSKAMLAKSQASYKFAYLTVINNEKISVFNWNIFLIIFLVAYVALFAVGAFLLYKYKKEKYKNDEFKRVNDKKYFKSSVLYGLGFMVIAYAIIFILMRAKGFANTIVAFNPSDPLLIAFAIAGMIIGGYFIVLAIKSIKTEKERKKAIRLKLNEDVEDDGTN